VARPQGGHFPSRDQSRLEARQRTQRVPSADNRPDTGTMGQGGENDYVTGPAESTT